MFIIDGVEYSYADGMALYRRQMIDAGFPIDQVDAHLAWLDQMVEAVGRARELSADPRRQSLPSLSSAELAKMLPELRLLQGDITDPDFIKAVRRAAREGDRAAFRSASEKITEAIDDAAVDERERHAKGCEFFFTNFERNGPGYKKENLPTPWAERVTDPIRSLFWSASCRDERVVDAMTIRRRLRRHWWTLTPERRKTLSARGLSFPR